MLEARLTAAGLTVVPATEMEQLQQKLRQALGGYYDPWTGEMDKTRSDAYDEHLWAEFRRLHPVDAWIRAGIELRRARGDGAYASWDGVMESSIGSAHPMQDMFKAPQVLGGLRALSLFVIVSRPDRQPLYLGYGGLNMSCIGWALPIDDSITPSQLA